MATGTRPRPGSKIGGRSSAADDTTTERALTPLERKIVVAALATDQLGRVLLTKRRDDQPMGGLWELPGGKVEPGESPPVALVREIAEEIGCGARVGEIYEVVHHVYPRFEVFLMVYRVELVGTPSPREVADIHWVLPVELTRYHVLPADVALIAEIARRGRVERAPQRARTTYKMLTRDSRTGSLNAHALHERLTEEIDRVARSDRPLSIVLVDVDDLGALNDRHGQHVGDQLLAHVVGHMQKNARATDRVGHIGGAEFALLLPDTAVGAAFGIADRLRADIAAQRLSVHREAPLGPVAVRCTISCGVASVSGRGASAEGLLARADAALWRAKVGGRNRTVIDSNRDAAAP